MPQCHESSSLLKQSAFVIRHTVLNKQQGAHDASKYITDTSCALFIFIIQIN